MKQLAVLLISAFFLAFPFAAHGAGSFSSAYSVDLPQGCIDVGGVTVCGPFRVNDIEIIEESTADILGACVFGASDTAATGVIPPGYQFWCERNGGSITVSSNQANLPIIRAHLVRASDNLSVLWAYYLPVGGLQGPGGAVFTDPYQHREFEFAGYKKLTFRTRAKKDYTWMRQHALEPLRKAGYTANLHSFAATSPGFTAEIGVYDTLDGRVLLEDDIIRPEGWKVVAGDETRGNRGAYEYLQKYTGTIKAEMHWLPPFQYFKAFETTGQVTFEYDESHSTEEADVYTTTADGTITQTVYTGMPGCPGPSFTDTYPTFPFDGYLVIRRGSNPAQYWADASISPNTPVTDKHYTWCCYGTCTEETLPRGGQEHPWLETGSADQTALSGGVLKGSFSDTTGSYEWEFHPLDPSVSPGMTTMQLLLLGN